MKLSTGAASKMLALPLGLSWGSMLTGQLVVCSPWWQPLTS